MRKRIVLFAVTIGLALAGSVCADDNVRVVQEKLRDGGFYSGEIDGAYSSELAAALTRYQVRKGLAVTGQLDVDTSDALGAKPAVATSAASREQSSETWRRLRRREPQTTSTNAREKSSPRADRADTEVEPAQSSPVATPVTSELAAQSADSPSLAAPISGAKPASAAAAKTRTSAEITEPASAPPATARTSSETAKPALAPAATVPSSSGDGDISTERLRDYVGAFVLAGLDPRVGSEADFFADRAKYYDQGMVDREKIRNDLQNYAARWPERHFWFAGNIIIEPQHRKRVRVTFPLRYELRNGATYSSGTINKTLVLEPVGDDLQIVAVSESKTE
jgi:Putative peptidoglycan binding domain